MLEVVKPKLTELANESGETAWFVIEENGYGVFVERARGSRSVRSIGRVGARLPLHTSASGKAILATLSDDRIGEIVDRHGLESTTDNTVTDREALFDEFKRIREEGVAYNWQESTKGMHAVSTAIETNDGACYGAIGVSGAARRMSREQCTDEVRNMVLATANEIELNLQYSDL